MISCMADEFIFPNQQPQDSIAKQSTTTKEPVISLLDSLPDSKSPANRSGEFPKSRDAMEVCSLHHGTESQGFDMRVGGLLDQRPDYKNARKSQVKSPVGGSTQYTAPAPHQNTFDMKRTHSESECSTKSQLTPRLSPKVPQKLKSCSSSNHIVSVENCEFQTTCNNNTSKVTDCEIFLGGSCNPTSWRRDIAIPILKDSGISFFNPQVASWCPELMAAEHEAKDVASVLFFVIDSETRAVASMLEVAYLISQGKNIILVITDLPRSGHVILGEPITPCETEELACAQSLLRKISARHEIRVFECIRAALRTTATLIHKDDHIKEMKEEGRLDEGNSPKSSPKEELHQSRLNGVPCSLTISHKAETLSGSVSTKFDVFVGGTFSNDTEKPHLFLKKHGLSSWSTELGPRSLLDDERMANTRFLFFYLNSSSRALETLILAAYYVGLCKNVVLCIENLSEGCLIGEELVIPLSKTAIKDYNRGRSYLRDISQRHGIPIFTSMSGALDSLVQKCKGESEANS